MRGLGVGSRLAHGIDRLLYLGHLEPKLTSIVPGLRHVVGRDLPVVHESVQRRTRDMKPVEDYLRRNQRFLLHSTSVSQSHCVSVLDSSTMRQWHSRTMVQMMGSRKQAWQRRQRADFRAEHGYSTTANYGAGGRRERILKRDGHRCVQCEMTDEQHKERWNRPITIDHISRDRADNSDTNLQTLCLSCHGRKDILPSLIAPRVLEHRTEIEARRASGHTFQQIADDLGFSIASIWKWARRWEREGQSS